jgi:hypothetical protein
MPDYIPFPRLLDFATIYIYIYILQSKVVSLASKAQLGGSDLKFLPFSKFDGTKKDNKNAVRVAGLFLKFLAVTAEMQTGILTETSQSYFRVVDR